MLTQLKQNDSKDNPQVQALNTLVAQTDSYNWGYDPVPLHGAGRIYATDPEARRALKVPHHGSGDQAGSGNERHYGRGVQPHQRRQPDRSPRYWIDRPWYYRRLNETTGSVESACCSDSAPEHRMFAQLIADSLAVWTTDYKIDGFAST